MLATSANTGAAFQEIVYLNTQMDSLNQKIQKIGHWHLLPALKHRSRFVATKVEQAVQSWEKPDVEVVYLCYPKQLNKFIDSREITKALYASMLSGKTKTDVERCLQKTEFIIAAKNQIEADPVYLQEVIDALVQKRGPDMAKAILHATPEGKGNLDLGKRRKSTCSTVRNSLIKRGESEKIITALLSKS